MEIKKAIQTPEGTMMIEGELDQEETNAVIEAGLTTLLQMGAFSARIQELEDEAGPEEDDTIQ
jgi:hypothetical protein